jgi:putative endonuclease
MKLLDLLYSFFPRGDLGRRGEAAAARYLQAQGLCILARNFRTRSGEVDLIARDGDMLVFVEVKARAASERGDGLERIDFRKARRIRRAARSYRKRLRGDGDQRYRIDGVLVEFPPGPRGRPAPAAIRWYPALYPFEEDESG